MKRPNKKAEGRSCLYFVHTEDGYVGVIASRIQARELDPNSVLICDENEVARFPQLGNSAAEKVVVSRAEKLGFFKAGNSAFFHRREKKIGLVYFIEAVGVSRVKIGYSDNPDKRLKQLLTGSPLTLELRATMPGSLTTEKELHQRFSHLRIENEWFTFADEIKDYISANCI